MRVVCREFYLFFIYFCFNDDSLTNAVVISLFIYMFSSKSSYSFVYFRYGFFTPPLCGPVAGWLFLLLSHIADWVVAFNK